jgi:hypothetical protein
MCVPLNEDNNYVDQENEMTSTEETTRKKVKFIQAYLYQDENFTDLQTGSIRKLTPVKANGEIDKSRKLIFFGQTQLISQHGPLPIQFPIDAKNLQGAMERFPQAMEEYVEDMVEEAKKMQRDEQSRIIVPGPLSTDSKIVLK